MITAPWEWVRLSGKRMPNESRRLFRTESMATES